MPSDVPSLTPSDCVTGRRDGSGAGAVTERTSNELRSYEGEV